MVIFQGMLVTLSPFFPSTATSSSDFAADINNMTTDPSSGYNITEAKYKDVGNIGTIVLGMFTNPITLAIIAVFTTVSLGVGMFFGGARNIPIAIGIGIFLGIIASLWNNTFTLISSLAKSNIYVNGVFTLITVCIGIIIIFLVSEFFMGQSQGVN